MKTPIDVLDIIFVGFLGIMAICIVTLTVSYTIKAVSYMFFS